MAGLPSNHFENNILVMQPPEMKAGSQFEKKYFFKHCQHGWRLPHPSTMFKDKKWTMPELMKFKDKLNGVKSKLNDFPLERWHKHTTAMNPSGAIQRALREEVDPELLTQAWCKFFETVCTFHLIPPQSIEAKELNTVHLCEAPGAFVAALNHYIATTLPQIKWNWMATTLNPHYEGNDPEKTIFDDRFIVPTEKHWTFGADHTGDILLEANMNHILNEARQRGISGKGTLMLVTADGSVDCQFNPGEQESLVSTLHLCEATTALLLLDKGGSLLLKAFTVFEAENVCLLYLLAFAFETLVAWKPATSREGNSEMYLVCMNYRGQSELSPWLEVLSKHYGQNFKSAPMFSLDSIPKAFLDQVEECADLFMNYQINVIERNIQTFYINDEGPRPKGRASTAYHNNNKIKYAVTKEFLYRYQPMSISSEAKLMPECQQLFPMNAGKQLHRVYDSSGQYSFNQKVRHKQQECSSIEIWKTLCAALNESDVILKGYHPFLHEENKLSVNLAGKACKVAPLESDLALQDVIVGPPLKKVLISKFCHSWLLHLHEQILSLWNQLKETSANKSQQGNTETVKNISHPDSADEELVDRTNTLQEKSDVIAKKSRLMEGDIPEIAVSSQSSVQFINRSSYAFEEDPSHHEEQNFIGQECILKVLTNGTNPCFVWCDKMHSGSFGTGLKELLNTLKDVEENGNLLILKTLPMLTRVEVGIIYLLSQLFQWLWFIWDNTDMNPGDERHYSILLNGRVCCGENQMKVQNFLGELSELAANEERKTNQQTLLAVVPLQLLCGQYQKWNFTQPYLEVKCLKSGASFPPEVNLHEVLQLHSAQYCRSAHFALSILEKMTGDLGNISFVDEISALKEHLNDTFLFLNGISICLMQLGFACIEIGSVRKKNSVSVLMKNVLDMFICSVVFWLVGYSLAFGTGNSFLGLSLWQIDSLVHQERSHWFFQLSFAAAASTIVSGAVAERCTLLAYAIYTTFISGLIYPIVVHWAWSSDGWLSVLGYKDLAGSGVVHSLGGSCALVGAIVLGSRIGRFENTVAEDQKHLKKEHSSFTPCSLACLANPIPGHSTLMVGIGGMLLAVTFLSFNGASIGQVTGGFGQDADAAATVAVNTILGGSGGIIVALFALKIHSYRYPKCSTPPWDLGITVNAALAGMVSTCAGVDVFSQWASLCTGLIAGLVFLTFKYVILCFKVDDPTDVASVHLGGGLWGLLARPLFTFPQYIIFEQDISHMKELLYNTAGAITITIWSTGVSFILFTILKKGKLLRVSPEHEIIGLDSSYETKNTCMDEIAMQTISNDDLTTTESV